MENTHIIKGNVIFTKTPQKFDLYENGYIIVENGKVKLITSALPESYKSFPITDYGDKLIIPGFVDLHLHAPQFRNLGLGLDKELIPWLEGYTFPEEAKFKDAAYASKIYKMVVKELWKQGTTRAVVFSSIHKDTTKLLFDLFIQAGLGAYIGKVNMDRNSPDYLIEESAQSVKDTEEIIKEYINKSDLVKPIITPRFVPSCTSALMKELGALAEKYDLPVQSHLSENMAEIEWIKSLHPECTSYTNVYETYGLLRQGKTIMAHCIHNTDTEIELLKKYRVFSAHCPTSNSNLSSGIMPLRRFLSEGLPVGLGSDISAGHKLSIPCVMNITVQMSKMKWLESGRQLAPLSTSEVFYLGTKGGGEFFGKVGSFEEDYEFDALVIDDSDLGDTTLSLEERIQRYIYIGDDRNIVDRYVRGKLITEPVF